MGSPPQSYLGPNNLIGKLIKMRLISVRNVPLTITEDTVMIEDEFGTLWWRDSNKPRNWVNMSTGIVYTSGLPKTILLRRSFRVGDEVTIKL